MRHPVQVVHRESKVLSVLCQLLPAATGKTAQDLRGVFDRFGIDSGTKPCPNAGFRLAVVTKAIPHSELFRILDLVLSFDPDAEISWVRILDDI